jgi:hypothetical protein
MNIYRQGDVLVRQVRRRERKGKDIREDGRVILAHGEVTGHAHEVIEERRLNFDQPAAQFFEEPDGRRFLFVERACVLVHQEHGAISLAPGCYEVTRQREYSPSEIRNVAD